MASTSLIYRSAALYEAAMLVLYGQHYFARHRVIADLIPQGSSVVELCCGPGYLYRRHLRRKVRGYYGIDINPRFVKQLIYCGAAGEVGDLRALQTLPQADYIVMQASLYHFLPEPSGIVDLMLQAARDRVIIAEPVRNLSCAKVPFLSWLAGRCADPGSGRHHHRFTEQTLDQFFADYSSRLCQSFLIPGGREKVYVLCGSPDGGVERRTPYGSRPSECR
jgi:hypothetical protein